MAASDVDIDFKKIGQAYVEFYQDQVDHVLTQRQRRENEKDLQNLQMTSPVSNMKFRVSHEDWEDRSNLMGGHAFTEVERSLEYSAHAGASGSVQCTQKKDEISKITITKGLIADGGILLNLPLPENPTCVRQQMGYDELPIDPSEQYQTQFQDKNKVRQEEELGNLSRGAKAEIQSRQTRYEGRFSCRVYPKGTCLLDRSGQQIFGSNPKIQDVIAALKRSNNPTHQQLVKNFYVEEEDQGERGRYYWKMEGKYEFRLGPSFSIKKK